MGKTKSSWRELREVFLFVRGERQRISIPMRIALHFLAAAFALTLCVLGQPVEARDRPNILVIMADDLGFSDLGPFGGEISTPALDALARDGRLMTSLHIPPLPDVAHAEFLFGVDHHSVVPRAPLGPIQQIRPETAKDLVSIAQVLRNAGYRTHMIGTWDAGAGTTLNPAAQGFDTSHALMSMAGDYFPPDDGNNPSEREHFHYMDNGRAVAPPPEYITDFWTDRLIADILADKNDGKPFFAYAAYTSPHFPLQAPASFIAKYRGKYDLGYDAVRLGRLARQKALGIFPKAFEPAHPVSNAMGFKKWDELTPEEKRYEARRMEVYAGMVANLDWNIGRLVAQLKANGLYDNTLIIFTASSTAAQSMTPHRRDGAVNNSLENLGLKNSWISYSERWAEVSNAPFSRWKAKGTEGGTVAPVIIHLPGQKGAKRPSDAMAMMRDLAPTLMDYAQITPDRVAYPYSGRSLRPLWEGRVSAVYPSDHVFADEYRDEGYVRQGRWKAVRISDFAVNAYDGGDAKVIEYMSALEQGDKGSADTIRAERPLRWMLYDMAADRGETRDLSSRYPVILGALVAKYESYIGAYGIPLNPGR